MSVDGSQIHRVVIVGGGFAGILCADGLARVPVEVTLIDRRNFHLFQPLLYQVATGGLSPANIAAPLRSMFHGRKNVRTLMGEVTGFDTTTKQVMLANLPPIPYDTLILAAGSTHHYFGKDAQWEPLAPGLKTLEDAIEIRRKVLSAFERAENDPDIANRGRHMTFLIVGGGPTGVEMAGSIAELSRQTLHGEFRAINSESARVILVENGPRVLQTFHEKSSINGLAALQALGVEVRLNTKVTDITADHVVVEHGGTMETIPTETVIWAAGVKASPLGKMLADALGGGIAVDRGGRVTIGPDCSIPGQPNIFVLGDMATQVGHDGKPLPGVAPVAMQHGAYVAKLLARKLRGESAPAPFRYWDKGNMATIGRSRAVAETHGFRFSGFMAWMAWLFIHVMYLARFENRVLVLFQWFWNYITRNRTARLITGETAAHKPGGAA